MKDWGESVSELMIGKKQLQETVCSSVLLGCFYPLYMLYSNLSRVLLLVLSCLVCNCCWFAMCIVLVVLCVLLSSYVYLLYCVCIAVFFCTLDARLLARSQYSEGPATGHLDTGFSWFPCA